MPDDDLKPDEAKPADGGPAPAIDLDALAERLTARLADHINKPGEPERQPEPVAQPISDPLGDLVREKVGGDVRAAMLRAEAAEDKADFYGENDEAREYKAEIERTFQQMMKNGRPMPRGDIWNYIKGRDLPKFVEKEEAKKKKKLDEAAAAASVGESGRRPAAPNKSPFDMTDDELNQAVAGQSF